MVGAFSFREVKDMIKESKLTKILSMFFANPLKSDNKNQSLRLNRAIANPKVIPIYLIIFDTILILMFNILLNVIFNFASILSNFGNEVYAESFWDWSLFGFYKFSTVGKFFYIPFFIFLIICDIKKAYDIRVSFGEEDINKGSAGTSRWTTLNEVKEQYKEIEMLPSRIVTQLVPCDGAILEPPEGGYEIERNDNEIKYRVPNFYDGKGGIPVTRVGNKFYIDPQLTNNLFLGTTRSGKGEMFVFPIIDILSRAREIKNRPSMIVFDPKLELYKSAKGTLEKRGYKVRLLNLDDPLRSAGYNPLDIITKYYSQGKHDEAQQLAKSFSFSIFNSSNDMSEPIWKNTATDLFTALIIAVVSDCVRDDEELNTKRKRRYEQMVENYKSLEPEIREDADKLLYKALKNNEDILSEQCPINAIPESYEFVESTENREKINCFSVINFFRELCDVASITTGEDEKAGQKKAETALDDYFNAREPLDYARSLYLSIKSAGDRTKGSIFVNMQSALTIFSLNSIAAMTAKNDIDFEEIGFGDKPVAIFCGLPTEDKSNHFLALNFVTQVFQYLFKLAKARNGVLGRNVRFILDEFGNMPILDNFGGMVTNCLGVGFSFDIFVQSYNQLHTNYEMEMDTIKDNFANQFYILAQGTDSANEFSEQLGNKTIIEVQRTGTRFGTNKSFMENGKERPLLFPNELKVFKEGETALIRGSHRTDVAGAAIESHPILCEYTELYPWQKFDAKRLTKENRKNNGPMRNRDDGRPLSFKEEYKYNLSNAERYYGTAFLYRYQYAISDFPNPTSISFDDICKESRKGINYTELVYDVSKVQERLLGNQRGNEFRKDEYKNMKRFDEIDNLLRCCIGSEYMSILGIEKETTITEMRNAVTRFLEENKATSSKEESLRQKLRKLINLI